MTTFTLLPGTRRFTRGATSMVASLSLVLGTLTAVAALAVVSAPDAQATNRISQQTGFNARAWTVTVPDATGTRYVGGDFTSYKAWDTGRAARVSLSDASVDPTFPSVSGEVQAVAPDGNGGYVIGGSFGSVNGQGRTRLAHILADGSLNPDFAPIVSNTVMSVAVDDTAVIIGGLFEQVNSTARLRVAALDLTNGQLLSWNPSASSWVRVVRVVGDGVYVGGQFGSVGGLTRNRLAHVRLDDRSNDTGTCLTNWDAADCITDFAPHFGGYGIFDVAVSGATVYATGSFTITPSGGSQLMHIAAMDDTTVADNVGVSTWNGGINGEASALTVHNGVLYVGGQFSQAGGQARGMGAAFDIASDPRNPPLTAWNPRAVGGGSYNNARQITDIEISGSTAYLSGSFWALGTATGSIARNRIGAVDLVNGDATSWDPHICDWTNGVSATSYDIAISGTTAVFGGDFSCVGGLQRKHAAAIGPDGILTSWSPAVDGPVLAFASDGQTIYMSGNFSQVVGQDGSGGSRSTTAAVSTAGAVTNWAPAPDGRPVDLLVSGSSVYLAGFFSNVGGVSRVGLAKVDATTGALDTGFDAKLDGAAEHLALANGRVYMAGRFSTADGQARPNYAAVNATTGALDPWNVGTPQAVNSAGESHGRGLYGTAIAVMGDRVFLGGSFLSITPVNSDDTAPRRYTAAVDAVTGALDLTWRPATVRGHNGNGDVYEIAATPTAIYLGGDNDFSITDNGVTRQRLAAVHPTTGALLSWDAQLGGGEIRGLSASSAAVFVVGSFGSVGGQSRQNSAAVDVNGNVLDPWPMDPATSLPLSVTVTGSASGAVVSAPGGINCGASCEYAYSTGSTVTLTAVPDAGAEFNGWTGDCTGTATSCTVSVTASRSASAQFVAAGSGGGGGGGQSPAPDPLDPPSAPRGLLVVSGDGRLTVSWQPPVSEGSFPISTYRVVAQPGGHTCLTSTKSCVLTGLTNGVSYSIVVQALSGAGWSAESNAIVATPEAVAASAIRITALPRTPTNRRDRIAITGDVVGLAKGQILRPYLRIRGQGPEVMGNARVRVRQDGSIRWHRNIRPQRVVTVYFELDGLRSNAVTWQRVR